MSAALFFFTSGDAWSQLLQPGKCASLQVPVRSGAAGTASPTAQHALHGPWPALIVDPLKSRSSAPASLERRTLSTALTPPRIPGPFLRLFLAESRPAAMTLHGPDESTDIVVAQCTLEAPSCTDRHGRTRSPEPERHMKRASSSACSADNCDSASRMACCCCVDSWAWFFRRANECSVVAAQDGILTQALHTRAVEICPDSRREVIHTLKLSVCLCLRVCTFVGAGAGAGAGHIQRYSGYVSSPAEL